MRWRGLLTAVRSDRMHTVFARIGVRSDRIQAFFARTAVRSDRIHAVFAAFTRSAPDESGQ
jgi:hypothetical protein